MLDHANIILWGRRIGLIRLDPNDSLIRFEYDREFLNSGIELSPFKMPLRDVVYSFPELSFETFRGLPGMLADSLPDRFGNAVIRDWLIRNGKKSEDFNSIDRLCYIGTRGMGALEFQPAYEPNETSIPIEVDQLVELASSVLSKRKSVDASINRLFENEQQLIALGSSAGGARAKAIIAWNKETNQVRSGQVNAGKGFKYYIIKFDGVSNNGDYGQEDPVQYTVIEYVYSLLAKKAGIHMTECDLFEDAGKRHFITERFDRENGKKIHMQTFGALMHLDYNQPRSSGYEALADCAHRLKIGKDGIDQIFRRMVFNVVAMNNDDHVKNFSFLMDRTGKWRLSPAYDLTFSYNPENFWLREHQMTINGKSKNISYDDLMQCGKTMGLSKRKIDSIINEVIVAASNWSHLAYSFNLNSKAIEYIDTLLTHQISSLLTQE